MHASISAPPARGPGMSLAEGAVVLLCLAVMGGMAAGALSFQSSLQGLAQGAAETARRTQCINNQRNLALAMQQHNANNFNLPGWAEPMVSRKEDAAAIPVSWVFPMLPYVERGDIYRNGTKVGAPTFNKNPRDWPPADGGDPHLKVLVCPNDKGAEKGMNLSYVANSGFRDRDAENIGPFGGGEPGYDGPEQDGPWSAVFVNRFQNAEVKNLPIQSLEAISGGDGTANTMMFSENVHAGRWDFGSDADPAAKPREALVTFNFADTLDGGETNVLRINGALRTDAKKGEGMLPGANSLHPGGVVVAFCDGHTVFIRQDVDWKTWCLLFTPNGERLKTTWPEGKGKPNVFHKMILEEKF